MSNIYGLRILQRCTSGGSCMFISVLGLNQKAAGRLVGNFIQGFFHNITYPNRFYQQSYKYYHFG